MHTLFLLELNSPEILIFVSLWVRGRNINSLWSYKIITIRIQCKLKVEVVTHDSAIFRYLKDSSSTNFLTVDI